MKKKICKLSAAVFAFFSWELWRLAWRFFNMVVCCKRGGKEKGKK